LVKKDGLPEIAEKIYQELISYFPVEIDVSGSIGKRYYRQDELGTPYCITVDYETKENLKAIQVFRAPIFFEKLRLKTEELSQKKGIPVIQLIPFGNLAMQRARASFIMNFFGCAGFKVEDPGDLKNKEGILNFLNQISNKKIDAFVLCSSDNEYLDMFKEIKNDLLAFKKSVLIAGLPESKEELQNQGIDDFIHIKSNLFETLERYQKLFLENN